MRTFLLLFLATLAIALSPAGAEPVSPDRLYNELYAIWLNGERNTIIYHGWVIVVRLLP